MDIVCFCHLRWDFVYQRPQHLLSRFADKFRVWVVEEPIFGAVSPALSVTNAKDNLQVIVPRLPGGQSAELCNTQQQALLQKFFEENHITKYIAWYYTPMALEIGENLPAPELVVYDCMDELSAFKNAPTDLRQNEILLLGKADLVFTGGQSLYNAKKFLHRNIHPFPSSIDKSHFAKARYIQDQPLDQIDIPYPRIGFFGVIDERLNIELLAEIAELKPRWQFIVIGPVVKIDPGSLPAFNNIHYLGSRSYADLPAYLSGWDVALIPFAINESTRYISPTKTPEYLAGGVPVVSTQIEDVVKPYGEQNLVAIAATAGEFITEIENSLKKKIDVAWRTRVDQFLANISWDNTWAAMWKLMSTELTKKKQLTNTKKETDYV